MSEQKHPRARRQAFLFSLFACTFFTVPHAQATPFVADQLPSQPQGCNTCHLNGSGGPLNLFGTQALDNLAGDVDTGTLNWPILCELDADQDGSTNGAELGDPCCDLQNGFASMPTANPSDVNSTSENICTLPSDWTCKSIYYDSDEECHCGCGILDPDCATDAIESCEVDLCDDGSQANPADPTSCLNNNEVPRSGWVCDVSWYNTRDGCDCGCGIIDLDCPRAPTLEDCTNDACDAAAQESLNPENVAECIIPNVSPSWQCTPSWYGGGNGCDCGCGDVDPDCQNSDFSFCANDACPSGEEIDENDPTECVPTTTVSCQQTKGAYLSVFSIFLFGFLRRQKQKVKEPQS